MNRLTKWSVAVVATGLAVAGGMAAGDSKLTAITEPAALTCSLSGPEMVDRRAELQAQFWPAIARVEELDDGYSLELAGNDAQLALDFVAFERECCSFLAFTLEFEPKNGPVRLTVAGPEGSKEFLAQFLNAAMDTKTKEPEAKKVAPKESFVERCCKALGI